MKILKLNIISLTLEKYGDLFIRYQIFSFSMLQKPIKSLRFDILGDFDNINFRLKLLQQCGILFLLTELFS